MAEKKQPSDLSAVDIQASEAVIRALIPQPKYPVENPRTHRCVTFITIEERDPPPEMFRNLVDVPCLLKPGSKFRSQFGDLLLSIKKIAWKNSELAEVEGSSYKDQYSANGWALKVQNRSGAWVVTNFRLTWIS